ncbi:MAG: hypothetical protein Q7S60_04345 [bacterium]|nr:hypothetical protein [bacterium]
MVENITGRVGLSTTQAIMLDEVSLGRFQDAIRAKCGTACNLTIRIPAERTEVIAHCNKCSRSKVPTAAAKSVPRLANARILDSSLVNLSDVQKANVDPDKLRMVKAISVPSSLDEAGTVLLGKVAAHLNPTGYVSTDGGRMLFPATTIDPSESINPGEPVLIERP